MKTKSTLLTMCAVVLIALATTACAEQGAQSSDPNAFAKESYSYSYPKNNQSKPSEESSSEALAINGDVMWGMDKTYDEVTEKYGSVTVEDLNNVYMFENGYGKYVFGNACRQIGDISAKDFLVGDISAVTLDNLAEKCGFNVVPLYDSDESGTMYDGYKMAYYTHPDYPNVSFSMLYNENGFDDSASFDVRLIYAEATDPLIITLNSVIDSAEDVDALNSGIKSADIGELTAEARAFENPIAFIENNEMTAGTLADGAVILVELSDGSCYIAVRGESTTDPVPVPFMLSHIVQRANSVEQLKAELDGYGRGASDKVVSKVAVYENGEAAAAGDDSGKTIIENGNIVGTDDDFKNSGDIARVEYDGGRAYGTFPLTDY